MTNYTVLKHETEDEDGEFRVPVWIEVGTVDASGTEQAIRKTANDGLGTYVAVPTRSFQPVHVAVKQRDPIVTITPLTRA